MEGRPSKSHNTEERTSIGSRKNNRQIPRVTFSKVSESVPSEVVGYVSTVPSKIDRVE